MLLASALGTRCLLHAFFLVKAYLVRSQPAGSLNMSTLHHHASLPCPLKDFMLFRFPAESIKSPPSSLAHYYSVPSPATTMHFSLNNFNPHLPTLRSSYPAATIINLLSLSSSLPYELSLSRSPSPHISPSTLPYTRPLFFSPHWPPQ